MAQMPYLIGVAGPSCAGKGTLCRWLANRFPAEILPVDAYYLPLNHLTLEERAHVNFDHPSSMDDRLLRQHLEALRRGETICRPVYDFTHHTRDAGAVEVTPRPVVLVEGLFPLYWPEIRELFSARIFITADNGVCLDRRLRRDTRERGRSPESIESQYADTVEPMRSQFVEPTAAHADLVLDGRQRIEDNGARAAEFLQERLGLAQSLKGTWAVTARERSFTPGKP